MKKDISIEYAHIYTNKDIDSEQKFSVEVLKDLIIKNKEKSVSLVVMVDDYSFPDPTFNYEVFTHWLENQGFPADIVLRESQLIESCDEVFSFIKNDLLKKEILSYIKTKRYPCSLFIATWYLLRLGFIKNKLFDTDLISDKLINILPLSFKPFEDKAFEIICSSDFASAVDKIENMYFEGRDIIKKEDSVTSH